MILRGAAPSLCTSDNCDSGTYLDSMGNCSGKCICVCDTIVHCFFTACASGCRTCTGPSITECLACENETLYRVTTNQPASMTSACVAVSRCNDPTISIFGDRTCGRLYTYLVTKVVT